jgi:effector-binding domain-containing protein
MTNSPPHWPAELPPLSTFNHWQLPDHIDERKAEMAAQPEIVKRTEQPYVAIRTLVTWQMLGEVAPRLHSEVRDWLRSRGVQPTGQPFFKYNVIDMDGKLEIEVGFPVAAPMTGEDQVLAAALPAGRYATLWHTGHPSGLAGATSTLLDWAAQQNLAFDVTPAPDGERWGCRLEIYHDEPGQDMNEWETELAFKLAD